MSKKEIISFRNEANWPSTNELRKHVSHRILDDPICYAHNTEVAYLTSSDQSHVL
jgi:hypothetical protein